MAKKGSCSSSPCARLLRPSTGLGFLMAVILAGCAKRAAPTPVECVIEYGGTAHLLTVSPTADPYRVAPLAIEDAFEFKAVYLAVPKVPRALGFYVYSLSERGPVLIEQTKYQAPFPRNAPSVNGTFTGSHHVYGPDGEELVYSCRFRSQ
jgi:hypothetical protein